MVRSKCSATAAAPGALLMWLMLMGDALGQGHLEVKPPEASLTNSPNLGSALLVIILNTALY